MTLTCWHCSLLSCFPKGSPWQPLLVHLQTRRFSLPSFPQLQCFARSKLHPQTGSFDGSPMSCQQNIKIHLDENPRFPGLRCISSGRFHQSGAADKASGHIQLWNSKIFLLSSFCAQIKACTHLSFPWLLCKHKLEMFHEVQQELANYGPQVRTDLWPIFYGL